MYGVENAGGISLGESEQEPTCEADSAGKPKGCPMFVVFRRFTGGSFVWVREIVGKDSVSANELTSPQYGLELQGFLVLAQ